ncbi:MAG: OmpH family outer membrane protein [Bryobacterales bacterium]|nr:OmpH family outer membrane protein [Bryobacterales bacterium]
MTKTVRNLGFAALAAALAAPSAPAQTLPTKIAIINIQGAILATRDGEKARNDIQAKFSARAKDLESRLAEINKRKDQFNKGANTMSAEAREKLSRDIDEMQKKYQWDSEDLQSDLDQEQGKYVNEIGQRMVQEIDAFAKDGGYAVVLDVSGQQNPVLWAATGIDITQEIVKRYDAKHGGGVPASGAAAPGAAPSSGITKPIVPAAPKRPVSTPK